MSNVMEEMVNDPHLKAKYFEPLEQVVIPIKYRDELKEIIKVKPTLVSSIDNTESYKIMLVALAAVQNHRDRAALITYHIEQALFFYEQKRKDAVTYLELKYYEFLSNAKDSLRKQAVASALRPVDDGIEKLEHLKKLASIATKKLDDTNWAVKTSSDIVSDYFNNCKTFKVTPNHEL